MKKKELKVIDQINSYEDFKIFLSDLISITPTFEDREDYIPETDWGEIKYYFEDKIYKIFYGGELENTYGMIDEYALLSKLYNETNDDIDYNLLQNLVIVLNYNDALINDLNDALPNIEEYQLIPGYFEVPSNKFWSVCLNHIEHLKYYFKDDFISNYEFKFEIIDKNRLSIDHFYTISYGNIPFNFLFYKENDLVIPIQPRCFLASIINDWNIHFKNTYKSKNILNYSEYNTKITPLIYRFIKERINTMHIYPFVSTIQSTDNPEIFVFSLMMVSIDTVYLFYILEPCFDENDIRHNYQNILSRILESKKAMKKAPTTIALLNEQQTIVFNHPKENMPMNIIPIIIVPKMFSTSFSISKHREVDIWLLDHFLYIIDELDTIDELADFHSFLSDVSKTKIFAFDFIDLFATFKMTKGVLVKGAIIPDFLMIRPHSGARYRYESLRKFWDLYPNSTLLGNPRSWKIDQRREDLLGLHSQALSSMAFFSETNRIKIWVESPILENQDPEKMHITYFLMECVIDSIIKRKDIFLKHNLFNNITEFLMLIIPKNIIYEDNNFEHLAILIDEEKYYSFDAGFIKQGVLGIKIIYDFNYIVDKYYERKDSYEDVLLLSFILRELNELINDKDLDNILDKLFETSDFLPRYVVHNKELQASFPFYFNYEEPDSKYYLLANRKVAQIARDNDILPGDYELEEAKNKLNLLRNKLVNYLENLIYEYDLSDAIPILITQIDSLINKYEVKLDRIELSTTHEIDYNPIETYAKQEQTYIKNHRNIRYLIEKFVSLQPSNNKLLSIDDYYYLVSLVDFILLIYSVSDSLHYGLFSIGITINEDYRLEVKNREDPSIQDQYFAKKAESILGISVNELDRIDSPRPIEEYLSELSDAFFVEYGFKIITMGTLMEILSFWPEYTDSEMQTCYSATLEKIANTVMCHITDVQIKEVKSAIDYLTLTNDRVLTILDQEDLSDDIPVWESKKRIYRYTLRPLLKVKGEYIWGAHSVSRSFKLWRDTLSLNIPIIDFEKDRIKNVIMNQQRLIEKEIEKKAYEIVGRYTDYNRMNFEPRKYNKNISEKIGEYDNISYIEDLNVIFNIECKYITPAFCLKDAQRNRRKIYGDDKEEGYIDKQIRRSDFLKNNIDKVFKLLKWDISYDETPLILNLFITLYDYYWTITPTKDAVIVFLKIDTFDDYIKHYNLALKE